MIEIIKRTQNQFKANLHSHSTLSDGKLTPEEMKNAYKKNGYSVLAITDHERPHDHSAMNEKDFLMLTGYEAYIRPSKDAKGLPLEPEIHINLIAKKPDNVKYVCYNRAFCKYLPADLHETLEKVGSQETRSYSPEYINSFVKTANENGYLCLYNHPVWSLETVDTAMKYEGFLSMEICNYSSYHAYFQEYNGAFYDTLIRNGKNLACHSADDNHNEYPFDSPRCDSFGAFTMILCENLDYESVIKALESGNFYSSMGPKITALSLDGNKVHVETSDAIRISLHGYGRVIQYIAGTPEKPIRQADFVLDDNAPYFRISVADAKIRFADTRAYRIKDGQLLPFDVTLR